jgi:hypothetical protein
MIRKTLIRSLVAAGAAAALVVLGGGTANAAVVDPGHTGITLDTNITFAVTNVLTITADASFTTSFIENTTLALQAVGNETYTDSDGNQQVVPLDCSPVSVEFSSTNHVGCQFWLEPNATVQINYTAEDAGLAPTPFTGSCAGTGVQITPGDTFTDKTC